MAFDGREAMIAVRRHISLCNAVSLRLVRRIADIAH
jgi:hypothetical protein